ncbi:MAG: hydroxymethylglutaryl-CoA lyase [Acidobacteriota bacterium]
MPGSVRIFEVGPRDGLQNESKLLPLSQKLEFVARLVDAGLKDIEVGAFVHPRWVPQMSESDALVPQLPRHDGVRYWALIPNRRGLERAIAAGVTHGCLLMSATESHSRRNLNRSIADGLAENEALAREASTHGLTLRGYISVVFGCPFEGNVSLDVTHRIADHYASIGVSEISLGDTTGMGHPDQVRAAAQRFIGAFGAERIAFHFHDTRGTGLANAYAVLDQGARTLDTSAGGIGGCPYAPGASGNLATEDLLHLLGRMNIETGVDVAKIVETSRWLRDGAGLTITAKYFQFATSGTSESLR